MKEQKSNSIKELFHVVSETKRNEGGFFLSILIDVIRSSIKYDMNYREYRIYEFHRLSREDRSKFIMRSDSERMDQRYNVGEGREVFSNKLNFAERFNSEYNRKYLDLRISGQSRFNDFVSQDDRFVAKQLGDNSGVSQIQITEKSNLEKLRRSLTAKKYYLFESFIHQCEPLEVLYPFSVNTVRVLTFVDADKNVHILNTALKLGNGTQRDNFSRGGLFSVPDETGLITRPFVNKYGKIYETHPLSNEPLIGFQIPRYDEAIELCKKAALEVEGIQYVGWDVAISDKEVILVDGSLLPKVFQIPPSVTAFSGEEIHDLRAIFSEYMDFDK